MFFAEKARNQFLAQPTKNYVPTKCLRLKKITFRCIFKDKIIKFIVRLNQIEMQTHLFSIALFDD